MLVKKRQHSKAVSQDVGLWVLPTDFVGATTSRRINILWVSFEIYMKTPSAILVTETLVSSDTRIELLGSCGEQARAIGQT